MKALTKMRNLGRLTALNEDVSINEFHSVGWERIFSTVGYPSEEANVWRYGWEVRTSH